MAGKYPQCTATTEAGDRCRRTTCRYASFCAAHKAYRAATVEHPKRRPWCLCRARAPKKGGTIGSYAIATQRQNEAQFKESHHSGRATHTAKIKGDYSTAIGGGESHAQRHRNAQYRGEFRRASDKNSNLTLQEPFLKLTNSIKHPNLPQQNSNAVQKKRRYPLMKISRPSRRRGPDRRRGWQAQAPLAVTFRFHVPVGDWKK